MALEYRHGRFSVDRKQFIVGGEGDTYAYNFVSDPYQGLGVLAKSLAISNHGGGKGENFLYFKTSQDGFSWDATTTIPPGGIENYQIGEEFVCYKIILWASNANLRFSLRATPGLWTLAELRQYIGTPAPPTPPMIMLSEIKV